MTGARVEIDDADVRARLGDAQRAGVDMPALLSDIGDAMRTRTQQRFEAQAGPGGVKWAPFAASTLRRMNKRRKPAQLLRDSNRLFQSIVSLVTGGAVLVGTNLAYAGVHQFGDTIKQDARSQTATFVLAKQGAGKKTDKDGNVTRVGSKLRFARASTRAKSRHEKTFDVGAREFTVPARPFLGLDDGDKAEIYAIVDEHMKRRGGVAP